MPNLAHPYSGEFSFVPTSAHTKAPNPHGLAAFAFRGVNAPERGQLTTLIRRLAQPETNSQQFAAHLRRIGSLAGVIASLVATTVVTGRLP